LTGDRGHDVLEGGLGDDILNGGAGSDRFVLSKNSGSDIIVDFQIGEDSLDLAGISSDAISVTQSGADTIITSNQVQLDRILNRTADDISHHIETTHL